MRPVLPAIFALLALPFVSRAEAPFSFESTPGKLPKSIVPQHYAIYIEPNLDQAKFKGAVRIDLDVRQPVRAIVLNSAGLTITKAVLHAEQDLNLKPQVDEQTQILTFPLADELKTGSYEFEIEFNGTLTEGRHGLFISRYATSHGDKRALMTHFEACDARRMFPCWDEPAFRSRFQLTAKVPMPWTAVSNMPVTRIYDEEPPTKEVYFQDTPLMSTYLLAFCAGEFEVLEDEVDGIKLRAITTEGKREQARYALQVTKQVLPYYNEYFGVKYPLPKLDQVSLASTGSGGMENWGCITYNDAVFLYDPANSSEQTKQVVYGVVAHELAHQWFGDLVTMAWWDNLWLNEGFASWMGAKATDHFNPTWMIRLRSANAKEGAMDLDAKQTTHPIQQPVQDEAQAMDIFDQITYQKGQAFLQMLENWLDEATFRNGIRLHMEQHAYSNATTADLWSALSEVSKRPVQEMAAGWTEQPGFPVVKVESSGPNQVRISQERFTVHQTNPKPLTWRIPVTLGQPLARSSRFLLLESQPQNVELTGSQALPVKANWGASGYYRSSYSPDLTQLLIQNLRTLSEADRLNLLNDSWALLTAGKSSTATFMDLVQALRGETSYVIVNDIISCLGEIDFLLRKSPDRTRFHEWARQFLAPQLQRLSWQQRENESPLDTMLRARLIRHLANYEEPSVMAEAKTRFEKFLNDPQSLRGDLRHAVLHCVGRYADDATYEKLHELGRKDPSTEQKNIYYGAMAGSLNPKHAGKTLATSITDELPAEAATSLVYHVAWQGEQPEAASDFATQHVQLLSGKLSALERNSYIPGLFRALTDADAANHLESFAKSNLPTSAEYEVRKSAEEIRFRAELKSRLIPELLTWLKAQPDKNASN